MSAPGEWIRRILYLLNRSRHEEALRREMEAHRAMMADPRRFGSALRLREESRDVWGWRPLEQLAQDVRFGARALLRAPGFSFAAIVTLALATGATTAIFSIVNRVLLRPLPFDDPHRLVQVYGRTWAAATSATEPDPLEGPLGADELEAYETRSRSFEGFAGYALGTRHLQSATGVDRLTTVVAEHDLFRVLGVDAVAGRTFQDGDPPDVAVISASLWRRRFGADPSLPERRCRSMEGRIPCSASCRTTSSSPTRPVR